jgi:NAD-dependent dihydropyrimidine dehydrogenase PreA subunit
MIGSAAVDGCDEEPGRTVPVIDRSRCEAKADCVEACPYSVFEVRKLTADDRRALTWFGRLRVAVHGGKQAFAAGASACHACGLCVKACPERAITLVAAGRVR